MPTGQEGYGLVYSLSTNGMTYDKANSRCLAETLNHDGISMHHYYRFVFDFHMASSQCTVSILLFASLKCNGDFILRNQTGVFRSIKVLVY